MDWVPAYLPTGVYNDIVMYTHDDYEALRDQFVAAVTKAGIAPVAVYQFGQVRTPGVSDLDLLIIVPDDQWSPAERVCRRLSRRSVMASYLFTHIPIVIPTTLVQYVPLIHSLGSVRLVQGHHDVLAEAQEDVEDRSARELAQHVLWNSFMRVAAIEMHGQPIGLRRALILLHNLLESIERGCAILGAGRDIAFNTTDIRAELIAAEPAMHLTLVTRYTNLIRTTLDHIDHRISQRNFAELAASCLDNTWPISLRLSIAGRSGDCAAAVREIALGKRLPLLRTLGVPAYLMALGLGMLWSSGPLRERLSRSFQANRALTSALEPLTPYSEALHRVAAFSRQHGVSNPLVTPFMIRTGPLFRLATMGWRM